MVATYIRDFFTHKETSIFVNEAWPLLIHSHIDLELNGMCNGSEFCMRE